MLIGFFQLVLTGQHIELHIKVILPQIQPCFNNQLLF